MDKALRPSSDSLRWGAEGRAGSWLPHRRLRRLGSPGDLSRGAWIVDRLTLLLAVASLAMTLRARADYALWPLLGLVLPALRWLLSASYRIRLRRVFQSHWNEAQKFSAGAGPVPWSAGLVLVVLPVFLFYVTNGQILGAIDTRPLIPTAVSLVREADWDLQEFLTADRFDVLHDRAGRILRCYQARGNGIYSAFPSGMVPFAVPVVGLARLCGADLDLRWVHLRLEKITAALVASLTLGLFFLAACCLGSSEAAAVMTVLLAIASGLYTSVGLGLWQHGGVAFWTLLALLVELRSSGRPSRCGTATQGIALGAMLVCRPTAALCVVCLGTWILVRSPRRAFLTAAVAVCAYLPCLLMYWVVYGNILGPSTINGNLSGEYWSFGRLESMLGVLLCPARGLFIYQPWVILAFLSLIPRIRTLSRQSGYRSGPDGWIGFCLTLTTAHCFMISAWHDWTGGDCWGSRMLTDLIPVLGLLAIPATIVLWRSPCTRAVIVALGFVGALAHLPCVYLGASSWNSAANHAKDVWSWSHAPFLFWPTGP